MHRDTWAGDTCIVSRPKYRDTKKNKKIKNKKNQSHMAFSSVLPFLLPTHSVNCAVHLLLCHSRALLVNSALFLPFTALIMPFFFSSPFFKYQSHMAFSSVLPFLLPTHSVNCAVHLLLCHSRALLVNSALFLPFTALIMPFFFSSPR